MELWILFGVFTLLMLIGTPIAFCLGVASFATVALHGPAAAGRLPAAEFRHERLLAAGHPLLHLCRRPDGARRHRPAASSPSPPRWSAICAAAWARSTSSTATLFGGISGSAVAEAAAVGGLMIPQMKARGYGADYAVNVTSMAALIALLLPPSHNMIIYSISAGGKISIADLFTAGIIPGLLLALALMVTAYFVARSRGYPTEPFPGFAAVGASRSPSPCPACC